MDFPSKMLWFFLFFNLGMFYVSMMISSKEHLTRQTVLTFWLPPGRSPAHGLTPYLLPTWERYLYVTNTVFALSYSHTNT